MTTTETYLKIEHKLLTISSRLGLVLLAFFLTKLVTDTDERFDEVEISITNLSRGAEERDKSLASLMLEVEKRLTRVEVLIEGNS